MKRAVLIGLLCAGGILSVQAESLWKKRSDDHAFLFNDSKARRVGDLLTVVVSEDTDVGSSEDRGMSKSDETKGAFDFNSETGGGFGNQAANVALDGTKTSSRKFDGESSFRTTQAFTDRMTVTVVDVLPNGNLVVSGQRRVRVAGDERTLVMSGVVRGIDVGPDNIVNSRHISELRLLYESAGPGQRFTRQGWFGRAMNKVWPF
ncbi:MAG: flagellar basal body L-ring protein FlgH [Planctomycetaceae bacterium]